MAKFARLALLLTVAIVVAAVVWWSIGRHPDRTELTLYGNVDLRQVVELALFPTAAEKGAILREVAAQEGGRNFT